MKSLFKIFTILTKKQQKVCILITFAMILGAMLEAVGIGAILPLIAIMGDPDFLLKHVQILDAVSKLGVHTHSEFIIACSGLLMFVYIFKNFYTAWQTKMQIDFSVKNQIEYSDRLLAQYLNKPYLYHLERNSSILLRNVTSIGNVVFVNILIPTLALFTEAITAFMIWILLIFIDPFAAIIVAGVMGGTLYAVLKAFRHRINRQGIIQNDCSAVCIKWLNQGLGAIKETKVLRKEAFFLDEFNKAYRKYGDAYGNFLFITQVPRMIIELVVVIGLLLLIIVKISLGNTPMDIVPLLGVLALAAFRLMPSANRIVSYSNCIKFQVPLFEELYEELLVIRDWKNDKKGNLFAVQPQKLPFEHELCVRHLSFQYPQGNGLVLADVNITIPKGSFVGIVGISGAGKTTFVDILLGLMKPNSGCITADGVDIYQNVREWQSNLGYVPQSIYLTDGTIRENVALGVAENEIDDQLVKKCIKMAEMAEFVEQLPNGLYTSVGECGSKLSGGQRQRIGIARALYYKPEILILDEATSALDMETEKSITETILKFKGAITIIAIAHRLSTLEKCDFKLKFESGMAEVVVAAEEK